MMSSDDKIQAAATEAEDYIRTLSNEEHEITSPGQLHDVTMENSYALGYRSPSMNLQHGGNSSPGQGRSVREFEEQMGALRNENFNLKLRLYFLEQKIPGYSSNANSSSDGHESLVKQNVDLKVDIEVLKRDLQQKQSLLCEAAKAMELMEEQQKENDEKSHGIIDELNQKIQYLEEENQQLERATSQQHMDQLMGRSDFTGDVDILQKVRELEGQVKQYEEKTEELINKQNELEQQLLAKNETLQGKETNIKQMEFQIAELQEQLDEKEKETANMEYAKLKDDLNDCKDKLANKTCELSEVEERLQEEVKLNRKSCKTIQQLLSTVKDLETEVNRLKRTSQESGSTFDTDSTALRGDNFSASKWEKMENLLVEKDAEIIRLKNEVKKKTANLQNLINKELWEKNREIERLTKLTNSRSSSSLAHEVDILQQSFSDSDYQKALEQNKQLQSKVDHLIQKLSVVNDSNTNQQLRAQVREAREDTERAELWRKQCTDLCSVLTVRLEELAGFLDSLLKHKDILCAVGVDRRRAMRKAVDSSLELSRSLNGISVSCSGLSIGDNSMEMLGNITNILDNVSDKENRTLNYNETIDDFGRNPVIDNLKAEVKALKKELEKKKIPESVKKDRRSLPGRLDNQSESEAWSEPDRKVSMARIGLEESLVKKIAARGKEDGNGNTSSDCNADASRKCKVKHHDKIIQLEQTILEKENKILKAQCELVDSDNKLKHETIRRHEAYRELDECRKQKAILEQEIVSFKQRLDELGSSADHVHTFKKQVEEKQATIDKLSQVRDQLSVEIRVAQMEIESLKERQNALQLKYQHDIEEARAHEQKKVSAIEVELSQKYEQQLQQIENKHREYLARDWISRRIFEQTKLELEEAQKKLTEAQFTIDFLRENESELSAQLIENEKLRRSLKQNLDEATLQSSKIVIERTKAITEKLQVEAQLQQLRTELEMIKQDRDEAIIRNNILNNQMMNVKSEVKKAVKQTSNCNDPSNSGSGYTSEEAVAMEFSRSERNVLQRLDNSSPDLGIESDAGRTSSTDQAGNSVKSHGKILRPKPELHHLNIVDEVSQDVSSSTTVNSPAHANHNDTTNNNDGSMLQEYPSGHDCAKVEQELAELRRKVIRHKRALENTWSSLRVSNKRKEQIERDIRHQIMETKHVLKNVRTNMESELAQPKFDSATTKESDPTENDK